MVSEAASVTESNRDRIIALTEQPHGSSWQLDVASWQIEHCVPPPAANIPRSRIASTISKAKHEGGGLSGTDLRGGVQ